MLLWIPFTESEERDGILENCKMCFKYHWTVKCFLPQYAIEELESFWKTLRACPLSREQEWGHHVKMRKAIKRKRNCWKAVSKAWLNKGFIEEKFRAVVNCGSACLRADQQEELTPQKYLAGYSKWELQFNREIKMKAIVLKRWL